VTTADDIRARIHDPLAHGATVPDLPAPDPHAGGLAVLHLIETGPRAVDCTRCTAQPGDPCQGVDRGHHTERSWLLRDHVIATLRHHLRLPMYGPVTTPTTQATPVPDTTAPSGTGRQTQWQPSGLADRIATLLTVARQIHWLPPIPEQEQRQRNDQAVDAFVDLVAEFCAAELRTAADMVDAETQRCKDDGVLEPDQYRPCRDATEQIRQHADTIHPGPVAPRNHAGTLSAEPS